jgi:iron complex outermembrane recepter protein
MLKYASSKFALAVAMAATSSPLFAQTAASTAGQTLDIEEIMVTAQRRDESLSKTPVAVAVVSSDTLAKAQIVTEQDLRFATPGLAVRATLNSNQLNYSLRGQSQDAFSGTRPGVMPYVNEVQIGGGSAGSTAFYDLQSIQVLKGPQGTLFGRSATGGAVLFTTAKPTDTFSGYGSALVGNLHALKFEGALSGPIGGGDALKARIAGFYSERHGFQTNLYDGGREGDYKRWGMRGSVTAKISDSVTNELMVDYYNSDSQNTVAVISGLLPLGAPGTPPYIPAQLLYGGVATPLDRGTGIAVLTGFTGGVLPPEAVAAAYDAYFASPRRPDNGLAGSLADQNARGPFIVNNDATNVFRTNNVIVSNATSFEINDNIKIRNIFGFARQESFTAFDTDGTAYGIGSNGLRGIFDAADACVCNESKQISDELQIVGTTSRLDYVAGIYYSDERADNLWRTQFFDIVGTAFGIPAAQDLHNDFGYHNTTLAGYAQGTFKLNDNGLAVTGGLRYTTEKVRKVSFATDSGLQTLIAAGTPPLNPQEKKYNSLSWTFGVQQQLDDLLLYVATRRSFKAGGYNGSISQNGDASVGGDAYEDERVTDVEGGFKYSGRLGEMPTRIGLAVYHNWLVDSQRTAYTIVNGGPAAITVNVPRGKVYGAEFEFMIKPVDMLTLGGTVNVTRSSFSGVSAGATDVCPAATKGATVIANGSAQCFDRVPDTPRASGTIFADVTVPVTDGIEMSLHGDAYYQAVSFTGPRSANNVGTTMPKYTIANFRVGLANTAAGWSLTGNLKNAFNKLHYVGGVNSGEIFQINTLVPGEVRTWTLEARFKF